MTSDTSTSKKKPQVVSHVPGRLRLKLHPRSRSRATMEDLGHKLRALAGVHDVRLNHDCGSVTVNYDKGQHSMAGMLAFMEDLDVVVESIGHLPTIQQDGDDAHENDQIPEFLAAINDLNGRIRRATRLPINLKLALPLIFLAGGIWSISRRGLMVEAVPGWLFMWLAFDIFVKLHPARSIQS